jgi:hypothetical protein
VGIRNARLGDLLGNGQEGVEALGDGPGEALLLCIVLDVPAGHVYGEEVACHVKGGKELIIGQFKIEGEIV